MEEEIIILELRSKINENRNGVFVLGKPSWGNLFSFKSPEIVYTITKKNDNVVITFENDAKQFISLEDYIVSYTVMQPNKAEEFYNANYDDVEKTRAQEVAQNSKIPKPL